jgi:hypothetical protein
MSQEALDRFRAVVVEDDGLQVRLSGFDDLQDFKEAVLQAGAERGFDFTSIELDHAIRAARRSWLERWIA